MTAANLPDYSRSVTDSHGEERRPAVAGRHFPRGRRTSRYVPAAQSPFDASLQPATPNTIWPARARPGPSCETDVRLAALRRSRGVCLNRESGRGRIPGLVGRHPNRLQLPRCQSPLAEQWPRAAPRHQPTVNVGNRRPNTASNVPGVNRTGTPRASRLCPVCRPWPAGKSGTWSRAPDDMGRRSAVVTGSVSPTGFVLPPTVRLTP